MDGQYTGDALAAALAARLRDASRELTLRWLDRIRERVALTPNRIFPTEALLDHVPLLFRGIADFIEDSARIVAADSSVVAYAMDLGELRHAQGFTEFEILKEFEIFGGILFAFLGRVATDVDATGPAWAGCAQRMFQAVMMLQEATTTRYLQLMGERVKEREERLRAFDRALTHELRNRIGVALGAAQLLETLDLDAAEQRRLAGVVARSASGMRIALDNLLELAHIDVDTRQQRNVRLAAVVAEAVRQLRDAAQAESVEVRIADELPDVEVSAAAVELSLVNLLSNAIKYRDPSSDRPFVEVSGRIVRDSEGTPIEVVVAVRDNGRGVPADLRDRLFERFFRAHADRAPQIDGTGLGLSIVRESVQQVGGRVWAEFPSDGGSIFAFTLPARRVADGP